ncbi:hypothetical protein VitviT2T_018526 [Vitis vinifera]|uniref:TIR domain-containing protein n=2 Tax=Vitis vinifera TaxID=29760 RepID=A0ABY9D043_VITVI|nr:hypothetical protein VitviT2T_018526 [Vitis vinifera]
MASTSSFRASSSSSTPSIPRTSTYDVFLSFRGEDTRYNFTDHLYSALGRRGIRTFRDDKLRRGEVIAPELLKAIEESRSSVIVFSENYARSRWCLDELVKIMECQKDLGHAVFPIFYHVDPSHVRKQEGSFGEAFARYEENWKDKIPRWRRALTEAANLSGWHPLDGYESDYIKEITNNIFRRLNCKRLDVDANLVGIDSRVKEVSLRLHMESSDVRIVGIYGVGGIGKTTIAKVIYNELCCEFEYMSFLENIRGISNTKGLTHLQNQLLGDILEKERSQNINIVDRGASMIGTILSSKTVFIVLDDVDDRNQLKALLRHCGWLGKGSRVIITTRNKHLLIEQKVDELYEVEGLNSKEACELFSLHAFKQNLPKSDFINLSWRMVDYCQGLPLALEVLGMHDLIQQMCWKIVRENFPKEPDKWSRLWDPHDIERALTTSEGIKGVETIDLDLSKLKRTAIRELPSSIDLESVEILDLSDCSKFEKFPENGANMKSLYDLSLENTVIKELPTGIANWESLQTLDLSSCLKFEKFPEKGGNMKSLKKLCFNGTAIKDLPDSIGDLESLKILDLSYCSKFEKFPEKGGNMKSLWKLNLKNTAIKDLPDSIGDLESLVSLDLSKCSKFEKFPEKGGNMKSLKRLYLNNTAIKDLPDSIGDLESLEILDLSKCSKFEKFPKKGGNMKSLKRLYVKNTAIKDLPDSIGDLESLKILDLSYCSKFEKFPEKGGNMKSLKQLYLINTAIKDLPDSIGDLEANIYIIICAGVEKLETQCLYSRK